jgi:hypothetical protein
VATQQKVRILLPGRPPDGREPAREPPGKRRCLAGRAAPPLYDGHDTLRPADPSVASVHPATATATATVSVRPVTLTGQDADRIAAEVDAARTESTRRFYAYTWGQWARWCAARDISPLPGDPGALCAYLTERAAEGIAISSLDGACIAIRHVHRVHVLADPVASETVRQVRLGLRRSYGTAPRRLAGHCPPPTSGRFSPPSTARPRSGSAMPRSSCSAPLRDAPLRAGRPHPARPGGEDRRFVSHGPPVQDRPGRTRPDRRRRPRHPPGDRPGRRPCGLAQAARPRTGTALFTRFFRSRISLRPLSGDAIARMLRTRAREAGLDAERITAHSL